MEEFTENDELLLEQIFLRLVKKNIFVNKLVLKRSNVSDSSVIELLQNIHCYMKHKREKKTGFTFDIFDQ